MYLFSISHSICSLIIFLEGRNMFFKISTNSTCSWAFEIFFLIFKILIMASCTRRIRSWTIPTLSSSRDLSVDNCSLPIKLIFPRFWIRPFFLDKTMLVTKSLKWRGLEFLLMKTYSQEYLHYRKFLVHPKHSIFDKIFRTCYFRRVQ